VNSEYFFNVHKFDDKYSRLELEHLLYHPE
jgi:hypothetical protein